MNEYDLPLESSWTQTATEISEDSNDSETLAGVYQICDRAYDIVNSWPLELAEIDSMYSQGQITELQREVLRREKSQELISQINEMVAHIEFLKATRYKQYTPFDDYYAIVITLLKTSKGAMVDKLLKDFIVLTKFVLKSFKSYRSEIQKIKMLHYRLFELLSVVRQAGEAPYANKALSIKQLRRVKPSDDFLLSYSTKIAFKPGANSLWKRLQTPAIYGNILALWIGLNIAVFGAAIIYVVLLSFDLEPILLLYVTFGFSFFAIWLFVMRNGDIFVRNIVRYDLPVRYRHIYGGGMRHFAIPMAKVISRLRK